MCQLGFIGSWAKTEENVCFPFLLITTDVLKTFITADLFQKRADNPFTSDDMTLSSIEK